MAKKPDPFKKNILKMEKKLSASYKKLSKDILKHSSLKILQKDASELMLLLGEANYLAKECKRMQKKSKTK